MTRALIQARDLFGLTGRQINADGSMTAPGTLARTGVQVYRAYELGLDAHGMDPMRLINLYRPPEEVFNPQSMASFENAPITIDHPPVDVTADNWKDLAQGHVTGVARVGDEMSATLHVKSQQAIDAIQAGKSQLSNGYSFELDLTPGTAPTGAAYDGIQRNIRGNHVAIVDAARCGSACRIGDAKPKNSGVKSMTIRKVVVDGIPLEVEDTVAAVIEKLVGERDKAVAKSNEPAAVTFKMGDASVTFTGDKVAEAMAAKDLEIANLKKDVMTPEARDAMVAEWAKTMGEAKALVPGFVTDGKTCLQVRREVVEQLSAKDEGAKAIALAVLAGKDVKTADAEVVRTAFNTLVAAVKPGGAGGVQHAADQDVATALLGGTANDSVKPSAASSYHERNAAAWQGAKK